MPSRVAVALSFFLCCVWASAGQSSADAGAALATDAGSLALPVRRVTQQNFIQLDDAQLHAIGRANPHAALILCDFGPSTQPSQVSIVAGQAVMTGLPTPATFQLVSAGSADAGAIAQSILALPDAGDYVETEWSSVRTPSGDIAVTFATRVMGRDGAVRRAAYPTIALTVRDASPSKILAWRMVR